ncbi:MAG: RNA methyltransferase [Anaerolineae bacterium]|nr:RNA methyltransferase [Gemmatimonadaceae bacterium]
MEASPIPCIHRAAVDLLTLARDLKRRKARERRGVFVAEGVRATEELLRSQIKCKGAVVSPQLSSNPRGVSLRVALADRGIPVRDVTQAEFLSASDTETPQGILAIGEIPDRTLDSLVVPARAHLLILDAIQDPGNLGTLIRTAAAFAATATFVLPGTVDPWNTKVVRSSMGALFRHPVISCTWEELDVFLRREAIQLWGSSADGEPMAVVSFPERIAIVAGNEGNGLSDSARARVSRLISIPIDPSVESLNVAVAAGILLYGARQ